MLTLHWSYYPSYMDPFPLSTKEVARLGWQLVRRAVRARPIVFFWLQEAMRSSCADGGPGRRADAQAFASDFVSVDA